MHEVRLEPVGDPGHLRVGVLHGEERRAGRHDHALREGVDGDGEVAAAINNLAPAGLVEDVLSPKGLGKEVLGLVDVLLDYANGGDLVETVRRFLDPNQWLPVWRRKLYHVCHIRRMISNDLDVKLERQFRVDIYEHIRGTDPNKVSRFVHLT